MGFNGVVRMALDEKAIEQTIEEKFDEYVRKNKIKWRIFTVWCIIFTTFIIYLFLALNTSRIDSCKQNYEGTRSIFKPFFSSNPTKAELHRQNRFNQRITDLKNNCEEQVSNFR